MTDARNGATPRTGVAASSGLLPTSGNERLVLLAVADACFRGDGTGCWPSVPTIGQKLAKSLELSWAPASR